MHHAVVGSVATIEEQRQRVGAARIEAGADPVSLHLAVSSNDNLLHEPRCLRSLNAETSTCLDPLGKHLSRFPSHRIKVSVQRSKTLQEQGLFNHPKRVWTGMTLSNQTRPKDRIIPYRNNLYEQRYRAN